MGKTKNQTRGGIGKINYELSKCVVDSVFVKLILLELIWL